MITALALDLQKQNYLKVITSPLCGFINSLERIINYEKKYRIYL